MKNTERMVDDFARRMESGLRIGVVGIVALRLAALLLPVDRMWGIDVLRDLSLWEALLYSLLPLLAVLLPQSASSRIDVLLRERGGAIARLLFLALLLAGALLPMETFFHGDGGLLVPQIHRFAAGESVDYTLLLNAKSSPLAGALIIGAMHALPGILPLLGLGQPTTALYPFPIVSALSLLVLALWTRRTLPAREQAVMAMLSTGSAGVLFFFGYVEYYAPVFVAVLIVLASATRTLRGEAPLWPVFVAYAFAVAAHYLALALLPAILYVTATRMRQGRIREFVVRHPLRMAAGVLGMFCVLYAAAGFASSDSRIVMPLFDVQSEAGTLRYTLLSWAHLADMVNVLLLLAPLALLPLFVRDNDGARSGERMFLLLSVLFLFSFVFFANTSLGLARDWDIAAPLGAALLLTAVAMTVRASRAVPMLLLASLALTLPWVAVNVRSEASAARFERLLALDSDKMYGDYALSGYEALRKYHRNRGNADKDIAITQRMVELLDYPLHYRELIGAVQPLARTNGARYAELQAWMLDRLARRAEDLRARGSMRDYSIGMEQIDSLAQAIGMLGMAGGVGADEAQLARIAAVTRGGRSWPGIDAMRAYAERRYAEAALLFESALREGHASPGAWLLFGNALALSGAPSAALDMLERGVAAFPDDGMLRFTLGKYYLRAGFRLERARELLQWCVDNGTPAEQLDEARAMLARLPR